MSIQEFEQIWPDQFSIAEEQSSRIRMAFYDSFQFTATGGIDWDQRPYSKKWFWPRHGKKSIQTLLSDLTSAVKVETFLIRSDTETVLIMDFHMVLKKIFDMILEGTFLWVFPASGRWIVEFSNDEYLHFDFCIPDEMKLIPYFGSCPFR